jgi:hypothetical protein
MIKIDKSKQRIFNKVAKHLIKQKKKSKDFTGNCRYRYGELCCAAGVLIPEEEYKPEMEGKGWLSMARKGFVSGENKFFVNQLQRMHDNVCVPLWRSELIKFAKQHKLNYNFLEV